MSGKLPESFYHGSENISNLDPRIWNLVPDRLKKLSLKSVSVDYVRPI